MEETSFFRSTVGAKIVVAVTGILLVVFIIGHMLGNLGIFAGQDAMNSYAKFLKDTGGLLWMARAGLILVFVVHIGSAISLKIRSVKARPTNYVRPATVQASTSSLTMIISGPVILAYVIVHLMHFTLGCIQPENFGLVDELGRHDVYSMVVLGFSNIYFAAGYGIATVLLCLHLSHGIPSFFQSLGLHHEKYTPMLKKLGPILAVLIAVGYISIPLSVQLGLLKLPAGVI